MSSCMSVCDCTVSGQLATHITVEFVERGETNPVDDMCGLLDEIEVEEGGLLLLDGGAALLLSAAFGMKSGVGYDVALFDSCLGGYLVVMGRRGCHQPGDIIPTSEVTH
ncbi:hypothetical protein HZC53_01355 [Candidatus Uhrbacteria bacterium]|nr:hypothetical protein [Candidatus Uhrbacteria bacterium]